MNSVDQIIEAYKRGLEDGRRGDYNRRPADPYDKFARLRQQFERQWTGDSPVDTSRITCGGECHG